MAADIPEYDLEAARKAGYSDKEIAEALTGTGQVKEYAGRAGYDYDRMRQSGYGDAEIAQALISKKPPSVAPPDAYDVGNRRALVRGLVSSVMPGNMADFGATLLGQKPVDPADSVLPRTADAAKFLRNWTGYDIEGPPPGDKEEALRHASIEGLGGSLGFGKGGAVSRGLGAISGFLGGGAQQAVSNALGPGNETPSAWTGMGLATALQSALFKTPHVVKVAQQAVRETTPEQRVIAQGNKYNADQVFNADQTGATANLSQGFAPGEAPTLKALTNAVMGSEVGGDMRKAAAQQLIEAIRRGRSLPNELFGNAPTGTITQHRINQTAQQASSRATPYDPTKPIFEQWRDSEPRAWDPLKEIASDGTNGSWDRLTSITDAQKFDPESVRFVASRLRLQDPDGQAFTSIIKKHWEDAASRLSDPNGSGETAGNAPQKFVMAVAGDKGSRERDSFKVQIEEAARSQGVPDKEIPDIVSGAEKVMDAMLLTSRVRGSARETDLNAAKRQAGGNVVSNVLRTPGLLVGASPAAAALEHTVYRNTYNQLANLLLSPSGFQQLQKIAKYRGDVNAAKVLAGTFLGQSGAFGAGAGQYVE